MRQSRLSERGFTLVELLIVMSIVSLSLLIANSSYTTFRESATLNRAARIVAADAALARSYAIRNRTTVSLVADEANQSYEVHDESGTVYLYRQFDAASEMKLETLDVKLSGDSLSFNSRGLMSSGSATIDVGRSGGMRRVTLNAIARWQIEQL
ncbi:MAG: GspH/FimT family pseudopilin [Gemmatimonadales bacterium]|jgi:prepilin-type N-terminal cleavage/methylation domain-containing protein